MSPCETNITFEGDIAVVSLKGTLEFDNVLSVSDKVKKDTIAKGYTKILIDLSQTKHINSKGLGALVSIQRTCTEENCCLVIINPNKQVSKLFVMTKLDTAFKIFSASFGELEEYFVQ